MLNPAQIRARVRKHVLKRGTESDFNITDSLCHYWWQKLNKACFYDQLKPPVRFVIKGFHKNAGYCDVWRANAKERRVVIGINRKISSRKTFLEVMAHEMIHQWGWEIESMWNPRYHGEKFFVWTDRLKATTGLDLCLAYEV